LFWIPLTGRLTSQIKEWSLILGWCKIRKSLWLGLGEKQVGEEIDVKAIEEKIIDIISEQMGVDKSEISRETSFINDLNADSLDTVELVMEFEDEFGTSIPDEEAEKIQTVGAAVDYIVNVMQSREEEQD
jgi:acyl carrier protein